MEKRCVACGGQLEPGVIRPRKTSVVIGAAELECTEPALTFVRPGAPTSGNRVKAFLQGLREEPEEQPLTLEAFRCVGCGRVELYANEG